MSAPLRYAWVDQMEAMCRDGTQAAASREDGRWRVWRGSGTIAEGKAADLFQAQCEAGAFLPTADVVWRRLVSVDPAPAPGICLGAYESQQGGGSWGWVFCFEGDLVDYGTEASLEAAQAEAEQRIRAAVVNPLIARRRASR